MRYRSVVHHLSTALFGESLPIAQFPESGLALRGLGMSDIEPCAVRLAAHLTYENTFYDREPKLDILAPPPERTGNNDFVISSDVLEHVAAPISRAFANLRALLRPGGVLVLTVPFVLEGDTREHFPDLFEFAIVQREDSHVLVNRTRDGRQEEYTDLRFHEGPGETLEMRLFSRSGLLRELERAGFQRITFHAEPKLEYGIYWPAAWSVPITAIAG